MPLHIRCSACKKHFKIKHKASTRVEFAADYGEYTYHQCSHCLMEREYHVNDVYQKSKNIIPFSSLIISSIIFIYLLQFENGTGDVILHSIVIAGYIFSAAMFFSSRENSFNSYKIRRNPKNNK